MKHRRPSKHWTNKRDRLFRVEQGWTKGSHKFLKSNAEQVQELELQLRGLTPVSAPLTKKKKVCKVTKGEHDFRFIKKETWFRWTWEEYQCPCGKTKNKSV